MTDKPQSALLTKHPQLIQSDDRKVISHVQRQEDDWYINTLMLDGVDTPFKYKRKKPYKSLQGCRVNLSYYACEQTIAGMSFAYMKVVRLKRS